MLVQEYYRVFPPELNHVVQKFSQILMIFLSLIEGSITSILIKKIFPKVVFFLEKSAKYCRLKNAKNDHRFSLFSIFLVNMEPKVKAKPIF